jgi:hypothetical protein
MKVTAQPPSMEVPLSTVGQITGPSGLLDVTGRAHADSGGHAAALVFVRRQRAVRLPTQFATVFDRAHFVQPA